MLETAAAHLRFGASMMLGRPFHRRSLERIVEALRATTAEFGTIGADGQEMLGGVALDPDTRRAVQERRLRMLAVRAAAETRHFGEVFSRCSIDPRELRLDQLAELPVLTKRELRGDPHRFVATGAPVVHRVSTTGTTGWPTSVWFTDDELYLFGTLSTIGTLTGRLIHPDDVVQIAVNARNRLGVHGLSFPATLVGAALHVTGLLAPEDTLRLLAEKRPDSRHKSQVSVMSTPPSYLGELVETATALGYRPADFGLERVFLGGEVTTAGLLRRARRVFGQVSFMDSYAITELAPFGTSPCTSGHLHYEPTVCLTEVLDLTRGRPAAAGEPGVLLGTPLPPFREGTLLLRFDTDDVVRPVADGTDCELARLPAFSRPLGKRSLATAHDDGWTFVRDVAEALEDLDSVPLPARFGFAADGGGVRVEALVRDDAPSVRSEIGAALERGGVPLRALRLVTDESELDDPVPLRCDGRERPRSATVPAG